jgi:hypothetical protein
MPKKALFFFDIYDFLRVEKVQCSFLAVPVWRHYEVFVGLGLKYRQHWFVGAVRKIGIKLFSHADIGVYRLFDAVAEGMHFDFFDVGVFDLPAGYLFCKLPECFLYFRRGRKNPVYHMFLLFPQKAGHRTIR